MEQIFVNLNTPRGEVDPKIFGHFCEHAFGNIYGGLYDPGSPLAQENGLRTDVLDLLRRVKPPILRYPGGNFVSNYHWEDGIGPKSDRKRVFEYAWLTEESNQFGTADFIGLCREVGAEPLICVNMGTGTVEEAMHWVEYCNGTGDTWYANLRRSHGYPAPFGVKYWGLGNEPYGGWQMNHLSAGAYAEKAFEFAKALKWVDPTIQLIACGFEQSSDWNHTVVKQLGGLIEYLSAHHYAVGWGPFERGNYLQNLSIPVYMEQLHNLTVAAILTGLNLGTTDIKVAWDEWNVNGWIFDGVNDDNSYGLDNAILTALILQMFIRNCDSIGMANYSTFVNINGAVSVRPDGAVTRAQYPVFELLANHTGKYFYPSEVIGEQLVVPTAAGPKSGRPAENINLAGSGKRKLPSCEIDVIGVTATGNEDGTLYLSIVNKHPDEAREMRIHLDHAPGAYQCVEAYEIHHADLQAANTAEHPDAVAIRAAARPTQQEGNWVYTAKEHSITLLAFRPV